MKNSPSAQLGDTLDLASEKTLLRVSTQREQCCHSAGSLAFDARGNLHVATGDNKPYRKYDFATRVSGDLYDPEKPVNDSILNTGIRDLPAAQPAFIYYPYGPSTKFPVVNSEGGRTAMAEPVYYFDPSLKSDRKLPAEFDHTLFIYEWSRNWIIAVHLDANDRIAKMERFCPNMTFKRPMDMALGPDGCLYLIEFGTAWGNNLDTQIVRLEYAGES